MAHSFVLNVGECQSTLALLTDGSVVAARQWQESRDMGQQLFRGMTSLLRENGEAPQTIADFCVVTNLPEVATARRIAETVARVYTGAVRMQTQLSLRR